MTRRLFSKDKRKNAIVLKICELIAELMGDEDDDDVLINMLDKIKEFNPQLTFNGQRAGIDVQKYEKYLLRKKYSFKFDFTPTMRPDKAEGLLRLLILSGGSLKKLAKNSGVSLNYISERCNGVQSQITQEYAYKLCAAVHFKIKPEELCEVIEKNALSHQISPNLSPEFED